MHHMLMTLLKNNYRITQHYFKRIKTKNGHKITYVILTIMVIIILSVIFQYYKTHSQAIRDDANDFEGGRICIGDLFP